MKEDIIAMALEAGYSSAEVAAAKKDIARRDHQRHPLGTRDKAGRFHAQERTVRVAAARTPSREWPWSEMTAARTAEHCAEVFGVEPLHVKRIARALALVPTERVSNHARLELLAKGGKVLKPVR